MLIKSRLAVPLIILGLIGSTLLLDAFRSPSDPGWPTKTEFRHQRWRPAEQLFIYPSGSESSALKTTLLQTAARSRRSKIHVIPADSVKHYPDDLARSYFGSPAQLSHLNLKLKPFGIQFEEQSFRIAEFQSGSQSDVLSFALPDPDAPKRALAVYCATDLQQLAKIFSNRRRLSGAGDYTVYRDGGVVAYGFYQQPGLGLPWQHAPERAVNFLAQQSIIAQQDTFSVSYVGAEAPKPEIERFLARQRVLLAQQAGTLGMDVGRFLPIQLVLYGSAESKTIATSNSAFSSWKPGEKKVHIVFSKYARGDDFTAIAEYINWQFAGRIPNPVLRRASGVLFSDNWGNDGYPVWASRLYHSGHFEKLQDLLNPSPKRAISPYIRDAQLAAYLQFVRFHVGPRDFRNLLRNFPEEPSDDDISGALPESVLQEWPVWCETKLPRERVPKIPHTQDFVNGFCYAHEGYAVYNGYMGSTSAAALRELKDRNVNGISITPFGYIRHPNQVSVIRKSLSAGAENDESVIVAGAYARDLGMEVMLKPHIWVSYQSWPGAIEMKSEADWQAFNQHYEDWISHYAILAQMQRFPSLCTGVELGRVTLSQEKAWRKMLSRIRKLYGGQVVYAANWGEEFENLQFWDALDAIGLNCYYPLSAKPDAGDEELLAGAKEIAARVARISKKFNRPVLMTEVGFASRPEPWREPHKDGRGASADPAAQERCYRAMFEAFYNQPWLAGMYIWKWPSYLEDGGMRHTGFTPNGKSATKVVDDWYGRR